MAEQYDIDYMKSEEITIPKPIKKKGETCWSWLHGNCHHMKNPEYCEYEHQKTKCVHFGKQENVNFKMNLINVIIFMEHRHRQKKKFFMIFNKKHG